MNSVDRQLAAILFADIVGYTALMQKGESTAFKILTRFQSTSKEQAKKYDGEIIKSYGDYLHVNMTHIRNKLISNTIEQTVPNHTQSS